MLIKAQCIRVKGPSDLMCTYYMLQSFVSLSHVRFDLIERLLQFFHISFCRWPANSQSLLLVRFGYLIFVRHALTVKGATGIFAHHVEVSLE